MGIFAHESTVFLAMKSMSGLPNSLSPARGGKEAQQITISPDSTPARMHSAASPLMEQCKM